MNTNIKISRFNKSLDFIFILWIPDIVGFLKMYSFVYLSFPLWEIRERTNWNVRFAFLHLKMLQMRVVGNIAVFIYDYVIPTM